MIKTFVVDIGTEISKKKKENFAWISDEGHFGNKLLSLKNQIVEDIQQGNRISIGFECPLYFDIYDERVNRQRDIDEGLSWSAGAGATATVTGMSQILWLLRSISETVENLNIKILESLNDFEKKTDIYIWEAFVSGNAKSKKEKNKHIADCKTALAEYQKILANKNHEISNKEHPCFSIIGALILKVLPEADTRILNQRPIVIKPDKPFTQVCNFHWEEMKTEQNNG